MARVEQTPGFKNGKVNTVKQTAKDWFLKSAPFAYPKGPFTEEEISTNAQDAFEKAVSEKNVRRMRKTLRWGAGIGLPILATLGGAGYYADTHPQETSDFLTETLGREKAVWIEEQYFNTQDKFTKFKYQIGLGPNEKPFKTPTQFISPIEPEAPQLSEQATTSQNINPVLLDESVLHVLPNPIPEVKKPKPFTPPDVHVLYSNPLPGEGSWVIDGLPTTKEDLIMAKTFIRPDGSRPYANTVIVIMDSRRVRLHMVGGKGEARVGGGNGPGKVPDSDLSNLLLVMNGGFQLWHAPQWGAYLDGNVYQALKPGYASTVVYKDGSIKIGTWGEGELAEKTEDMEAVRQNSVLLVKNGEITPAAKNEKDTGTWGLIAANSPDFITWRSAIGLLEDGNLMVAFGSSMSPYNLAASLKAAGAYTAMQLDINNNWLKGGVADGHNERGELVLEKIMDGLNTGSDLLKNPQTRDILYITRDDDSRFK